MKPHILFICISDGFGGLELQMAQRTKDAIEKYNFGLIITQKDSKLSKYCANNNIPFIEVNQKIDYIDIPVIFKLLSIIKKNTINSIVCSKSKELSLAVFASKISKTKPKVFFYQQMQNGIIKKDYFHNFIYKNISGAIVIAPFMKKQIQGTTIIDPSKVFVNYIGIKLENYRKENYNKQQIRKDIGLKSDSFVVLNVGRMDAQKDQITLIKAFDKANITNSQLLLVGEGYFKKECETLVEALKIKDKVIFLGFRYDIEKIYNACDLFVIPSLTETLGIVIIESFASKIPVIGTNGGGIRDLIKDRERGLLFEPRDYLKLSELILELYNNKDLYKYLTENAYEFAQSNLNFYEQRKSFFNFIEEILNKNNK
jgi:glycosyltransferase involved in cell wall biosynthesis